MNYLGIHYLVSQETHCALMGPLTSGEVVDIINAMPREEAVKYYNASRYELGKRGLYPRTEAGDANLANDVQSSGVNFPLQPRHGMYA